MQDDVHGDLLPLDSKRRARTVRAARSRLMGCRHLATLTAKQPDPQRILDQHRGPALAAYKCNGDRWGQAFMALP